MLRKKSLIIILFTLLIILFFYASINLILLRSDFGDIYPEYSTLRSDPKGSKAIFYALKSLESKQVTQNMQNLQELPGNLNSILCFLGVSYYSFLNTDKQTAEKLDLLMSNGSTVLVTLSPIEFDSLRYFYSLSNEISDDSTSCDSIEQKDNFNFSRHLGIDLAIDKKLVPDSAYVIRENLFRNQDIRWISDLYFSNLDKTWKALLNCAHEPVLIYKEVGEGKLILSADSFFLSNEAMFSNRNTNLIGWIFSEKEKIIFDETHSGIIHRKNISTLIRNYNLGWVVLAFIILAVLYVWKSGSSFLPKYQSYTNQKEYIEVDNSEGLVNLLKSNIKKEIIFKTCYNEWSKSNLFNKKISSNKIESVRKITDRVNNKNNEDIVQNYNEICELLNSKDEK